MSTSTANVIKMSASKTEKLKALESAIGQIEKAFGKGSVMKLGSMTSRRNSRSVIPPLKKSAHAMLDYALVPDVFFP